MGLSVSFFHEFYLQAIRKLKEHAQRVSDTVAKLDSASDWTLLIVFGGIDSSASFLADLFIFDTFSQTWQVPVCDLVAAILGLAMHVDSSSLQPVAAMSDFDFPSIKCF